jgi:exodeoxyribonuclease-5
MKNIKLTNCQEHAFQKFLSFLEDSSYKAFILKGYAGTGKTTLTKQFIDELVKRELPFSLLASTGRAPRSGGFVIFVICLKLI